MGPKKQDGRSRRIVFRRTYSKQPCLRSLDKMSFNATTTGVGPKNKQELIVKWLSPIIVDIEKGPIEPSVRLGQE